MGRTTDEWAALLNNTTPGPWFANVRGFGRIENIGPISTGFDIGDGLDCDEDDAELAALAPDAVAEVIRLRRALETVRDKHLRLAGEMRPGIAHTVTKSYADDLDRILNGKVINHD